MGLTDRKLRAVLFFEAGGEDWEREFAPAALSALCRAVRKLPAAAEFLFLTSNELALGTPDKATLAGTLLEEPGPWSRGPEVRSLLARRLLARGLPGDAPVLLLSGRCPGLSPRTLGEALRRFEAGARIVGSLTLPRNHPCQWRMLFTLRQVGALLAVDQAAQPFPGWLAGRPLAYDWQRDLLALAGRALDRDTAPETVAGTVLWQRLGPDSARVLAPRDDVSAEAEFLGLSEDGAAVLLTARRHAGRLRVRLNDAGFGRGQRTNLSVFGVGGQAVHAACADLDRFEPRAELSLNGLAAAERLFFALRDPVESGAYDVAEHFEPADRFWTYEKVSMRPLDADGRSIWGRQAFPEVFRLSEHFLLARLEDLADLPGLLAAGEVRGLVLPADEEAVVGNFVDALRFDLAWRKSAEDRHAA